MEQINQARLSHPLHTLGCLKAVSRMHKKQPQKHEATKTMYTIAHNSRNTNQFLVSIVVRTEVGHGRRTAATCVSGQ